jgi:predicted AlkP superfamily phosphohydrolase/phosphomutase
VHRDGATTRRSGPCRLQSAFSSELRPNVAWDAAVGRIIAVAPADARVLVFSLHGMAANDGWFEYLQQIVEQVHRGGAAPAPRKGLVYSVKQALPWRLVRQVTRRIPHAWNKALVPLWSAKMYDWSRTRYFALPMDLNGYIRLNVKGREAEGIVDPSEIDAVCAERAAIERRQV